MHDTSAIWGIDHRSVEGTKLDQMRRGHDVKPPLSCQCLMSRLRRLRACVTRIIRCAIAVLSLVPVVVIVVTR